MRTTAWLQGQVCWQDIALLKLNNSRATRRNPDARRIGTKCLHVVSSATLKDRRHSSSCLLFSILSLDASLSLSLSFLRGSANGRAKEILARSFLGARRERQCYCYDAIKFAGNGNYDLNDQSFSRIGNPFTAFTSRTHCGDI